MVKGLKTLFTEKFLTSALGTKTNLRVLEIGCGKAEYIKEFLTLHPAITYVGIEPITISYHQAQKNIGHLPNVKLYHSLGYQDLAEEMASSFDVVYSMSVLEHVKQLPRFLAFAARYAKTGGVIMHRYDLGHALHPHNWWARLHVLIGNTIPAVLPERQFVRYVAPQQVIDLNTKCGIEHQKVTYHQMLGHKEIEKISYIDQTLQQAAVQQIFDWEEANQLLFATMSIRDREFYLPAVAIWGKKIS